MPSARTIKARNGKYYKSNAESNRSSEPLVSNIVLIQSPKSELLVSNIRLIQSAKGEPLVSNIGKTEKTFKNEQRSKDAAAKKRPNTSGV